MVLQFLHLLGYGILLGSQVFQTFINGLTAFHALQNPYFGLHQAAIFPVYFSLQSFLPFFVVWTSPDLERVYRLMGLASLAGLINLLIFRPLTASAVKAKMVQEMKEKKKRDAAKKDDPSPSPPASASPELVSRQRRFMVIHATSIFINVCGLLATAAYGVELGMLLE